MNEEIVISCLMRDTKNSLTLIEDSGITPSHFLPGITQRAFAFLLNRTEQGLSIEPEEIYYESPDLLKEFDGYISGLALFIQWRLNREADGKLEQAIREMKHQSLIRNKTGKLKRIISK
jgi:hypothetical protein